ncbi:MAG: AAA family ATPase [Flavobacteriales bacterium]|nr:AAA family ATPase [Flavobacteriales bacterium]|tara:strand:- start:7368 stop:8330 length:963 start_codon:yes stop_codon:yes gene_type:complete
MTKNEELQLVKLLIDKYDLTKQEIAKVIIGQEEVIKQILSTIFVGGHALLVGVPGLGKTLLVNTIAKILGLDFNRVQFTPDLMPSDILGNDILNEDRKFQFIQGPVFCNILLADEINRTPPKTQSALLQAMEEKSVTIGGKTHFLSNPFFVLATQNPIEQEGTYPLPEAQLDRFMYSISLDYPSIEEEFAIVKKTTLSKTSDVQQVFTSQDILKFQQLIIDIPVNDNVINYAVQLVHKTRPNLSKSSSYVNKYIKFGAGPRASQYLIRGAKVNAILSGKFTPDIEDVQSISSFVLGHRIVRSYKAHAEDVSVSQIIKNLY